MIEVVAQLVEHFADEVAKGAPVGVTVPAVVQHGTVRSAANIDRAWIDFEGEKAMRRASAAMSCSSTTPTRPGTASCTTAPPRTRTAWSSSPPSAPASAARSSTTTCSCPTASWATCRSTARRREGGRVVDQGRLGLTYEDYILRLQRYYSVVEALFSPDLFVVGGGISKESDQFLPFLKLRTPIIPATLQNRAGIIGAARLAVEAASSPRAGL